ncbi:MULTISPECIES: hypothetical protein [unclassified Aquimarina]|uniref:hypothetical protein n=1 Tax=unclassified Aquimarina TaxID=2627091 RepID=UPI000E4727E8|nr:MULTISPECIES: hypothetical protein [unclassified Aquimarina]AXT53069.1 hypothetical protein D1818_20390 [Aquimarina sp. BL5]KAA1242555.1 hypothetical protein F0000_25095 [Aquimarina sp. RZ0]RKM95065.1 hypothetical protein D7036_21600 [Aquimarina sp. BL5]
MKMIKLITTLLITFTLTGAIAQSNKQVVKTRTTKTYEFKKDGKTVPYRITVYKTGKSKVMLDESDKGKLNQDIKATPQQVTKLIYVDNDLYSDYDKYIVLRYTKDANDSFELKPTEKGFKVIVDNKNVEYIFGEGVYFVNNADKDYFFVDEFDSI